MTEIIEITTYDESTGRVTGHVRCDHKNAEANSPYILGKFPAQEFLIINGEPVRKPDEEIEAVEVHKYWLTLRKNRNGLLSESDWTQIPDAPLTEAQKTEWQTYRQQLRDLPANTEDPRNVTWPTKPSS
jgi:hypothetical protein